MKKLGRELEVAYDIAYAARTRHYTLVECRKFVGRVVEA